MRLANWKRAHSKLASGKIAGLKQSGGFTLIELMIVVAVIAILSAIAIPAYNDYVTRGKLVDATSNLADMRIQMEQYYQDNRAYGSTGCGVALPTSKYFTFSCNWGASGDNQSYKVTATGTINKTNFTYTIDDTNTKTSTTGWGNGTTCWIMRKGDSC